MSGVSLPPFDRAALLLDLDGTLLDFAPKPNLVVVPSGLPDTLLALRALLGDALAVITGRPVEQVEALLNGVPAAIAGEHGGAFRFRQDAPIERPPLPDTPLEWLVAAEALAKEHDGVLLEHKAHGFVLHYRGAPAVGSVLHVVLANMLQQQSDYVLMSAHMAWEVRPRGTDKGRAVMELMARAPFAGRIPLFIGDDVTDNDAIQAALGMGGCGFQVAEAFGGPADVRTWLCKATEAGHWPSLPLAS